MAMTRLLIFLCCICVAVANGATNTAATLSYADVQSAILASASGDTVSLPSGSVNWTNQMTVLQSLNIIGAGTNATVILCTNTVFYYTPTNPIGVFRVSSIAFSNATESTVGNGTLGINSSATSGTNALFRVDHCRFYRGSRCVWPRGRNEGVIDHCTFINSDIAIAPQGDESYSWARAITPGTTNTVVIEDCRFIKNDDAAGNVANQSIYHQGGARSVIRYCVFDGSTRTNYDVVWFDSHGNQSSGADNADTNTWLSIRGQPLIEIYGNTFTSHHTYLFCDFRGGSVLMWSNSFVDVTSSAPNPQRLWEEEAWQTSFFDPVRSATNHGYPAFDQISNAFFWGNTANGTAVTTVSLSHSAEESYFIQENRDYWLQAPNSTNGSPAGVYQTYTPLTYPHPLVTAQDGTPTPTGFVQQMNVGTLRIGP